MLASRHQFQHSVEVVVMSVRTRKVVAVAAGSLAFLVVLTGCSSGSSSGGSSSGSGTAPACTEASIKAAIAPSDQVDGWGCVQRDGGLVAAASVSVSNGDQTVFWFKSGGTQWYPADGKALCSQSLPSDLSKFCSGGGGGGGSTSPTATPASICNDTALGDIIKQVDAGAKIDGFQCATTSTGELAAVKVTNGGLVKTFFFENEGGKWVLVNNSVCKDPAVVSDPTFQEYCKTA